MEMQWHYLFAFSAFKPSSLSFKAFLKLNIQFNIQQQCNVQSILYNIQRNKRSDSSLFLIQSFVSLRSDLFKQEEILKLCKYKQWYIYCLSSKNGGQTGILRMYNLPIFICIFFVVSKNKNLAFRKRNPFLEQFSLANWQTELLDTSAIYWTMTEVYILVFGQSIFIENLFYIWMLWAPRKINQLG